MPEFSGGYSGGGVVRAHGATAGTSSVSTTLTSSASTNTKGTAVELIAATAFDANWIEIDFTNMTASANFLVDILIGAATEQVIIPDLIAVARATGGSFSAYLFPVFIPKGSRLAAQCQDHIGSGTLNISIRLISGISMSAGSGPSWVDAYGSVASSIGTNVDPGATPDTDVIVEITASTVRAHRWLVVASRFGDLSVAATNWRLSVGIGASTEAILIPDMHSSADLTTDVPCNWVRHFPVFIPKGSRLTAIMRCSTGTNGDRDANIKFYGAG
jgi:hypothetical protein